MQGQRLSLLSLAAAGAMWTAAPPAAADGLDGKRFVPAAGAAGGFRSSRRLVLQTSTGGRRFSAMRTAGVVLDTSSGDIVAKPLEKALTLDLIGSVGLFDFAELAVHLPVNLVYDGDDVAIGGQAYAAATGVGDLRLMPKFRLLATDSFGLGVAVPVRLPTGDDAEVRGAGDITVEPKLLLSWSERPARARRQPRLPAAHHRREGGRTAPAATS